MLGELRTSLLTPKSYYELYMNIFDYLGTLENYFSNTVKNGTPALEIYEAVQHAGNVLPRLYLMITAGSVYIRCGQTTPKIICTDLIEYIKGVQHPQRGLFVRYYLIQRMKDKLPEDEPSVDCSSSSSSSNSAIIFLTNNLIEMNRLWVRMQTPSGGIVRNRKRRERERLELRILVGANLSRLSNVPHLDLFVYKTDILPKVMTEIIDCKDKIAQAYLFESLLQVFPLDLHLRTLDTLLGILPKLVSDHITIKTVALALLARITEGATLHGDQHTGTVNIPAPSSIGLPSPTTVNGNLPSDIDVFGIILSFISNLAADTDGPFRPTPAGSAGSGTTNKKGGEKNKDDSDDDAPTVGGSNPVNVSPVKPVRVPSSSTNKLAALREAGDAAAAAQPLASLLGIFSALEAFSIALYPKHQPYIDAVLGTTSKSLRDALGISAAQDPNSLTSMDYAPATQSVSASLPEAAVALEHLLTTENTANVSGTLAVAPPIFPSSSSASTSNNVPLPSASPLDETCSKLVVSILEAAQIAFELDVLQLSNYGTLLSVLPYRYKREVAAQLCQTVLDGSVTHNLRVRTVDVTRRLYHSLQPLIRDEDATPSDLLSDTEEKKQFTLQQDNMALLSTLLGPVSSSIVTVDDCTLKYKIFTVARDFLSWGGPRRISVTYPAILGEILQLANTLRTIDHSSTESTVLLKNIFELIHDLCFTLSIADHSELSLSMFLKAALHCQDSSFAYEFFSQAFLIYEVITDSRKQYTNLQHIINALQSSSILDTDAYQTLVTRCTQLSTRLLRKSDQVRTLVNISSLFWHSKLNGNGEYRKGKELIACLQRSLRIADTTLPPNPSLFIDILNAYLVHYENKVPGITVQQINDLVTLAQQHVEHANIVSAAASAFLLQQSKRRLMQSSPSIAAETTTHHHQHHHSHATSNDTATTIHPNETDVPKYLETTLQKVSKVTGSTNSNTGTTKGGDNALDI